MQQFQFHSDIFTMRPPFTSAESQIGLLKRLGRPEGKVDVVLDTDTYNEIDDQFALSYMMKSDDKLNVQAIYAAPFHNQKSNGPEDGMEKSYQEILKLLALLEMDDFAENVFKGSVRYLSSEHEPVRSAASEDLARRAMQYSAENPLYVVAIGAITNVASAILQNPEIVDRIVIVWLGGNATEYPLNNEFNLIQDIAAARVIFGCGAALVQLPCMGVVSSFTVSGPEMQAYFKGKNALCDYLAENTISEAESYAKGKAWTRVIWDVTAVAWLLDESFMSDCLVPSPIPEYDHHYSTCKTRHPIRYVYLIHRDHLLNDLIAKLTK